MTAETQKLALIQLIAALQDCDLLEQIQGLVEKKLKRNGAVKMEGKKKRQYGFAKGMTLYIAPDFDETPPGFEEYMLQPL